MSFAYTIPSDGQVSLAVYDSTGRLVRTLACGSKQAAGTHVATWDGLDDYGKAAAPGQYQWRLLSTPGFSRELLVNVGVTHPWSLCDVWPGNHAGPTLVYVDQDDAVYVASVSSEGPPHLLKMTTDGKLKYWDDGTWGNQDGITGLLAQGNYLYVRGSAGVKVLFRRNGNSANVAVPSGLTFPDPLQATDTKHNQTLKVVGNTVQRINVDGSIAAVIGSSRVYGTYDPTQFDGILSITCNSCGDLYVVEQYPRRLSRWDHKGNLLGEWVGGFQWGSMASFDPTDPTTAYVPVDPLHWGRAKLDFPSGSWKLTHLYPPVANSSTVNGKTVVRDILPGSPSEGYFEVRHAGVQTFLLNKQGNQQSGQSGVLVLRVDAEQLTPVAYLGALHPSADRAKLPSWWLAAQGLPATTVFSSYTHFAFSWSDANGNGLVDTPEIQLASVGSTYNDTRVWSVDENWNLASIVNGKLTTITNEGTSTDPKWNWDHMKAVPLSSSESFSEYRGTYATPDGSLWAIGVTMTGIPAANTQNWPSSLNTGARLMKFLSTGQQLAACGRWALTPAAGPVAPGTFSDPRAIIGSVSVPTETGPCVVSMDATWGGHAAVWTSDGLYAGSFEDDIGSGASLVEQQWQALAYGSQITSAGGNKTYGNTTTIYNDTHWGHLFTAPDGTVYWGSMGVNSTPLYRITGFGGWVRQSGVLMV